MYFYQTFERWKYEGPNAPKIYGIDVQTLKVDFNTPIARV